ncbi:UTRA domain-containing protein [Microbacterium sp. NPDC087589]|uniref:UTRA domain-containing protein n=1 Tax=Microbacterium sp. NPDC087589 TaxID=3364191 RepID=UPI0038298485
MSLPVAAHARRHDARREAEDRARAATTRESELRSLPKNAALLTMSRTAFDNSGRAVEYGHHAYSPRSLLVRDHARRQVKRRGRTDRIASEPGSGPAT